MLLLRLTLISVLLIAPSLALAQTAKGQTAIYVVDLAKLFAESSPGRAARERIEKEMIRRREEMQNAGRSIQAEISDLDKQKAILSDAALSEKKKALEGKQKELGRKARDHEDAIRMLEQKELKTFNDVVRAAVSKVAKAQGAPMVLPKDDRFVVYASEKYDLTAAVIKELSKE